MIVFFPNTGLYLRTKYWDIFPQYSTRVRWKDIATNYRTEEEALEAFENMKKVAQDENHPQRFFMKAATDFELEYKLIYE